MSQIKQRSIKQSKKLIKKPDSSPLENGHSMSLVGKGHRDLELASRDYFDLKKEESTTFHEETGAFDFDEALLNNYYTGNRVDLSHLFLHNEDDSSVRFPIDD